MKYTGQIKITKRYATRTHGEVLPGCLGTYTWPSSSEHQSTMSMNLAVWVCLFVCITSALGDGWHGLDHHEAEDHHHHHVKTITVTKKVPVPYPVTVYKKVTLSLPLPLNFSAYNFTVDMKLEELCHS